MPKDQILSWIRRFRVIRWSVPPPPPDLRSSSFGWLTPVSRAKRGRARLPSEALAKEGRLRAHDVFYVYLICSGAFPQQRYVGFTKDLKKRLAAHNAGGSVHTSKYKPWKLVSYHAFAERRRAQEFEHCLKTGSGKAFANKRLW